MINPKIMNKEQQEPIEDVISLNDIMDMFLPRWRWFLLSVVVVMGLAVLYLLSAADSYTRSADILIKDNSKGGSVDAGNDFADMSIFRSNTNINNEITTLKSPTLMTEVIKRLRLNETYTIREGLKSVELYKETPVTVTIHNKVKKPLTFDITLTDNDNFEISSIKYGSDEYDAEIRGRIGQSVKTPVGVMTVNATKKARKKYIGTTIEYANMDIDLLADSYSDALQAELTKEEGTIINLSIDATSIEKAEDILNTLIKVYNEYWILDKNQIAVSTSRFIGERLGVIEGELGHVDANISSYKSANLLPDVQAASQLYLTQSAESKKILLELNDQLATAQFIRHELKTKSIDQTLPSNSGIDNTSIQSQITDYNKGVLDRNRLLSNSSETNPLVVDLTNSLESMKKTIIQSIDNYIVVINTQISSNRQQEATTTSKLASNPTQAKYLLSVERQQKVKEELYLYLLQKREENELSQAFTAYNTRVITAPRGSMFPTAPRKKLILFIAFVASLLLPAIVFYIKDSVDTKIRGRKDLEKLTIPFIGEIPLYVAPGKRLFGRRKKKGTEQMVVVKEGSRDVINEAFRVLRSNIDFMTSGDRQKNVIVMTSFNPGSGKSFLTMNIANTYALKGKKILVIDGDLRHGTASAYVNKPSQGFSDFLGNRIADWHTVIVKDERYADLHILPVGTVPPNPTELLEEGRLQRIIEEARKEYDYIFIDCPPIDIVADTQLIEKYADRTIFIVRAGLFDRSMLADLESIYQQKRFKNLALILNGTEGAGGYGYRYGYKYGYRY